MIALGSIKLKASPGGFVHLQRFATHKGLQSPNVNQWGLNGFAKIGNQCSRRAKADLVILKAKSRKCGDLKEAV